METHKQIEQTLGTQAALGVYYFITWRGTEYCDVGLSVCLSVCLLAYLKNHMAELQLLSLIHI